MRKILMLMVLLTTATSLFAQVAVNNDGQPAHASAMLDVKNPNKGLLVPRVALTGTNDATTIPSPATSLLVFNTATTTGGTAVTPGYYYWSGTSWLQIATATSSGSSGTTWLLTGNTGTVDGTNFIGTTDNVPFNVRVNNEKAGRIDNTLFNTFWGYLAGNSNTTGSSNTAMGRSALYSNTTGFNNTANGNQALYSNTTGSNNTANGASALFSNTTGVNNTANGRGALYSNTTGFYNTANGNQALYSNTIGRYNTANGHTALQFNTTGEYNTANGKDALNANTTGRYNTATGESALYYNTIGYNNTANGASALYSNTTGFGNTANGLGALYSNTTGSKNTAIGYDANVTSGALTNATAIGYNADVNASNKIRLGNTAVTVIEGQVAYSFPSDSRFKYNINTNVPGLDFITRLTPVTYNFDEQKLAEYNKTGILNNSIARHASYNSDKQLHTAFLHRTLRK